MKYEQEIIDMENFYSTATIEEAIAYFKMQSDKALLAIKAACKRAIRIISGISRFFQAKPCTALRLRRDLNRGKVLMNKAVIKGVTVRDIDDQIGMDETLLQAIEILIKN